MFSGFILNRIIGNYFMVCFRLNLKLFRMVSNSLFIDIAVYYISHQIKIQIKSRLIAVTNLCSVIDHMVHLL